MVDECENIRIGTTLVANVYSTVVKWYGSQVPEAFDDAIFAWNTGYFEGKPVFLASDPGIAHEQIADPDPQQVNDTVPGEVVPKDTNGHEMRSIRRSDPRIDLSRTNGTRRYV